MSLEGFSFPPAVGEEDQGQLRGLLGGVKDKAEARAPPAPDTWQVFVGATLGPCSQHT